MIVDVLGISGSAMAMARRFDRSVSWVSRRLALVEQLPETVQQQVRSGEISAHAARKYLAPVARANLKDCQRMADVFAGQVTLLSKATDLTLFMRHGLAWASPGTMPQACTPV